MRITRRKLRGLIKEELSLFLEQIGNNALLGEITTSPGSAWMDFPDRPITDLTSLGHPPEGSVSFEEPDLDPDDDEDDMDEIIDIIFDSLTPDEIRAFEYMLKSRRSGESRSDFIKRQYGGDPAQIMGYIAPGRSTDF